MLPYAYRSDTSDFTLHDFANTQTPLIKYGLETLRFVPPDALLRILHDGELTPPLLADLLVQTTPELCDRILTALHSKRREAVAALLERWASQPWRVAANQAVWQRLIALEAEGLLRPEACADDQEAEDEDDGTPDPVFDLRLAAAAEVVAFWRFVAQLQGQSPGLLFHVLPCLQDAYSRTLLDGYLSFLYDDAAYDRLVREALQPLLAEEDARLQAIEQAANAMAQGEAVWTTLALSNAERAAAERVADELWASHRLNQRWSQMRSEQTLAEIHPWLDEQTGTAAAKDHGAAAMASADTALPPDFTPIPILLPSRVDRVTAAGYFAFFSAEASQQGLLSLETFLRPYGDDPAHRIDDEFVALALELLLDGIDAPVRQRILRLRREAQLQALQVKARMLEQFFWGLRHHAHHPGLLTMLMNAAQDSALLPEGIRQHEAYSQPVPPSLETADAETATAEPECQSLAQDEVADTSLPLIPCLASLADWPEAGERQQAQLTFAAGVAVAAGHTPLTANLPRLGGLLGQAFAPLAALLWRALSPTDALAVLPHVQAASNRAHGLANLAQALRLLALNDDGVHGDPVETWLQTLAQRQPGTAATLRRWMEWEFHDLQFLPATTLAQALQHVSRRQLAVAAACSDTFTRERLRQAFPDLPETSSVSGLQTRLQQAAITPLIALAGDSIRAELPLLNLHRLPSGNLDLDAAPPAQAAQAEAAAITAPLFDVAPELDQPQAAWAAIHLLWLHRSEPEAAYGLWGQIPAAKRPCLLGALLACLLPPAIEQPPAPGSMLEALLAFEHEARKKSPLSSSLSDSASRRLSLLEIQALLATPGDDPRALAADQQAALRQAVLARLGRFVCCLPESEVLDLRTALQADYPQVWAALAPGLARAFLALSRLEQLPDRGIQCWIRECGTEDLAMFLKACRPDFAERVYANLSRRTGEFMREDVMRLESVDTGRLLEALRHLLDGLAASLADGEDEDSERCA